MAFIFKETLVHSAFFYNFRIWSSGWLISRKMDKWRAGGWIDRGERGRGRGGPHGTIKAPSCAVVCWPPILLLTCDYSKNPRLRNWLLRTCSTKICQLGTDHYIFDEGGGGGCWKMLKKILCRGCKYQTLIIYTKKLLNSDWLRKECSSSVTRVQTCNTSAKLVTRVQITNGFWLAENTKETTKNQSD